MTHPFVEGYMNKEAFTRIKVPGLGNVGLLGVAILGLTVAAPAAIGMGLGYGAGRLSANKSPGVLKSQLRKQEMQELEHDLAFNQRLEDYKRGAPEPKQKEIHI